VPEYLTVVRKHKIKHLAENLGMLVFNVMLSMKIGKEDYERDIVL